MSSSWIHSAPSATIMTLNFSGHFFQPPLPSPQLLGVTCLSEALLSASGGRPHPGPLPFSHYLLSHDCHGYISGPEVTCKLQIYISCGSKFLSGGSAWMSQRSPKLHTSKIDLMVSPSPAWPLPVFPVSRNGTIPIQVNLRVILFCFFP